ncbi:MAG: cupredoxin domain-containing protein [Chloroflexi bacterium]|nr:cupredoxin domain-containing protein [Chloroflexota bacterium]
MKKVSFVLLLGLILTLAACGNGGSSTTINVLFTDFAFNPTEFTIPAGQEITVNATNNGAVVHEFVIMKYGQTIGDTFGDEDEENIYWEVEVDPGQSKTETFTAPTEPGEYQLVCGTEGHFAAGMYGKIIVVAGE